MPCSPNWFIKFIQSITIEGAWKRADKQGETAETENGWMTVNKPEKGMVSSAFIFL